MSEPTSQETKTCPYCGETILTAAKKCRFCKTFLDGTTALANPAAARPGPREIARSEISPATEKAAPAVEARGESTPPDFTKPRTTPPPPSRPPVERVSGQEVPHVSEGDQPHPKAGWKHAKVTWKHAVGAVAGLVLIFLGINLYDWLATRHHQEQIEQLYAAVKDGRIENVRALLEKGADPNAAVTKVIDSAGTEGPIKPLEQAAKDGHVEIVKLLLEKGADPKADDASALSMAATRGHIEVVKLLLEKGGNPNEALKCAVMMGHVEVVNLLLEKGADSNTMDSTLGPVLNCAVGNIEVVKLLIEKGANMKATDKFGTTALMAAADFGNADVVRLLIEKGADPNSADKMGNMLLPPIVQAASSGRVEVVKLLLERGVDPNAHLSDPGDRQDGQTALMQAAWNGHADVVKLLLESGADPNAANKAGDTALTLASEKDHADCVDLLREAARSPYAETREEWLKRMAEEANKNADGGPKSNPEEQPRQERQQESSSPNSERRGGLVDCVIRNKSWPGGPAGLTGRVVGSIGSTLLIAWNNRPGTVPPSSNIDTDTLDRYFEVKCGGNAPTSAQAMPPTRPPTPTPTRQAPPPAVPAPQASAPAPQAPPAQEYPNMSGWTLRVKDVSYGLPIGTVGQVMKDTGDKIYIQWRGAMGNFESKSEVGKRLERVGSQSAAPSNSQAPAANMVGWKVRVTASGFEVPAGTVGTVFSDSGGKIEVQWQGTSKSSVIAKTGMAFLVEVVEKR